MLDLRSAGQLVGVLLVARVLAYGIVRLIETVKPRPVHFIITAAVEREPKFPPDSTATAAGTSQSKNPPGSKLEKRVRKSRRWSIRKYHYYLINMINVRRRGQKPERRFLPKLLTEIIRLLAAGLSLIELILKSFFK
ncbi:MAG: hypothetical protein PVH64_02780 [Bacillota bacterium]|jgi:hypothetical protein